MKFEEIILFFSCSAYLCFIIKFRKQDFFKKPLSTAIGISIIITTVTFLFLLNDFFNFKVDELVLILISLFLTFLAFLKLLKSHPDITLDSDTLVSGSCSEFKIEKHAGFVSLVKLIYFKKSYFVCVSCGKKHVVTSPLFFVLFFIPSLVILYFVLNSEMALFDIKFLCLVILVMILPVFLSFLYLANKSKKP